MLNKKTEFFVNINLYFGFVARLATNFHFPKHFLSALLTPLSTFFSLFFFSGAVIKKYHQPTQQFAIIRFLNRFVLFVSQFKFIYLFIYLVLAKLAFCPHEKMAAEYHCLRLKFLKVCNFLFFANDSLGPEDNC